MLCAPAKSNAVLSGWIKVPPTTSVPSTTQLPMKHTSISPQGVLSSSNSSVGQDAELPVHFSPISQTPVSALHSVVSDSNASVGQSAVEPSQNSATSQIPLEALHSTLFSANTSVGQVLVVPSHFSATSQIPLAALHSKFNGSTLSTHDPEPSQVSKSSHAASLPPHGVSTGSNTSVGQDTELPSHVSAGSQKPVEALHSVPELPGTFEQTPTMQASTVQALLSSHSESSTHASSGEREKH